MMDSRSHDGGLSEATVMARLSERVFGWLLLLYPAELRLQYGVEMARAFRDEARDAQRRDRRSALGRLWLKACADLARTRWTTRRDRRAAARRAGNSHPAPPGNPMEGILKDLRLGVRELIRNPVASIAASVTLAIGVGASVTMFSGLSNFVLDPLPFANQDALYSVYSISTGRGDGDYAVSYLDYLAFRASGAFDSSAAYYGAGYNLAGSDAPVRVDTLRAGAELFATLGVDAQHGRTFTAAEDDADAAVLVISDALWRRQFGADPGVVGTTARLNGEPYAIVGVMPRDFFFPAPQYDAWAPLDVEPTTYGRDARFLSVIGRLDAGLAAGEAQARLTAVAQRLGQTEPATNAAFGAAYLAPLAEEIIWEEMRMSLYMLTITGVLVLLIACVNVANLLVARGMARRRELAVRAALGAGRLRLVRQYLAENVALGVMGGALGLLIARFGIAGIGSALAANEPGRVPRLQEYLDAGLDARVMLFAIAASLGAVLLFALVPALHGTRGDLLGGLQEGTRGAGTGARGRRLQKSLVVVEMALTLALLIGAGLALRSYAVVMDTDPGMRTDGLLTMAVVLSGPRYAEEHAAIDAFEHITASLGSLPGVAGSAATSSLPHARQGSFRSLEIEGRPAADAGDRPAANYVATTPNYFEVLGATMARGRPLLSTDDADAPRVAVINETFARQLGADDPVGARIRAAGGSADALWIEIVGVVADIRNNGLHRPTWPSLYVPLQQAGAARRMNLVVRAAGSVPTDESGRTTASAAGEEALARRAADPLLLAAPARAALAEIDPDLPLFRMMSMQQVLDNRFWGETLTMNLLAWCAFGALVLAVVGIYGVISYSVTQRTREMGIRVALGARAGDVVGLVVRQGLWLSAFGIALGLALGFGLSRGLRFMLFGVDALDVVTYVSVVALLAAVAVVASYVPARRATRVDPVVALRDE